ncbi:MAG: GTPase Era [Sphingomonas bacterium]|uniref:GTPase Era n=1 Tax=Sphingomonas bacterium TaxID=1895847 RepID=UPI002625DC5B|nr:GTPase Era [Sphingomonas bacterium]MDB5695144.1 GTPase Era [Sphingomonas bacterium]
MTSCGLVAIVGAPNAGKSTLVNRLVGQKVAAVSPKAQTTRARLMGVAMEGDTQLLLVDTPGIFEPQRRLDRAMVAAAWGGADGADLLCLVVDGKGGIGPKVTAVIEAIAQRPEPKWLILNKVDLAAKEKLLIHAEKLNAAVPFAETWFVSAETGDGVPELKTAMAKHMPAGAWHYPEDQVSDASERSMATEITREQIFRRLHAELPYASLVDTETFEERADGSVEIRQLVMVERPTQRAIVLGKGGQMLKAIGAAARAELSELWGKPVHLYLHVKVKPGWDEDRESYRGMGLDWVE